MRGFEALEWDGGREWDGAWEGIGGKGREDRTFGGVTRLVLAPVA